MISQAFEWIDSQAAIMERDLVSLADQNSGSSNLQGLLQVASWIQEWMDLPGATFESIELPARRMLDDACQWQAVETGPALRWDITADAPRRILLAIHYDTVFAESSPFQQCELLHESPVDSSVTDALFEAPRYLRGPGVADAKGGIVVIRAACQALVNHSLLGDLGLTVLLNPDEELGSPCSRRLLHNIAPEFQFGLLFEPALPTGQLVSARKGSGNFDLIVRGKSAHAGRHFHDGRNAITHLCRLLGELDGLNGKYEGVTLNVGLIQGGGALNVVPALARGGFNIRVPSMDLGESMLAEVRQMVASANSNTDYEVELHGEIAAPPKPISAELGSFMDAVSDSSQRVGLGTVDWVSTGGVCDGNKLAAAGLTNIDTLGPIGGGLHSELEWVNLDSLPAKAKMIVDFVSRFAQGELGLSKN